jgi:rod shape-determining protein MreD
MRHIKIALCVILFTVLESSVFAQFTIIGVRPDLVLLLIVAFGLLGGWRMGMVTAIIGGTLEGLMLGQAIGLRVCSFIVVGLLAGVITTKVDKDSFLTMIVAASLATAVNTATMFLSLMMAGVKISSRYVCMEMIFPKVLYNTLIITLFRGAFYHLYSWIVAGERDIL